MRHLRRVSGVNAMQRSCCRAAQAHEHVPRRSAYIVAAVADDEQVEGVGVAVDRREGDLERNY